MLEATNKINLHSTQTDVFNNMYSEDGLDYSSRRSSSCYHPYRTGSTPSASNLLDVPGRQNTWDKISPNQILSLQHNYPSTLSLLSRCSTTNSFIYIKPTKIRYQIGSGFILTGLCSLVLGIVLLAIGNQSYETQSMATGGYFTLFMGILLIFIGISVILCKTRPKELDDIQGPKLERRVSTIESESGISLPESPSSAPPEILITTDSFNDGNYKKFPNPRPDTNNTDIDRNEASRSNESFFLAMQTRWTTDNSHTHF